MFDQATITQNIARINRVKFSSASMTPKAGSEMSTQDKAITEGWRKQALKFWAKAQKELDNGKG